MVKHIPSIGDGGKVFIEKMWKQRKDSDGLDKPSIVVLILGMQL